MKRIHLQTIFVIFALIAASCQCSMACSVQPCHDNKPTSPTSDESPPPCHQHDQPDQSKAPQGCLHTLFLIDHRAQSTTAPEVLETVVAILPAQSALFAALDAQQREIPQEASPPHSPELVFSTILRL